MRGIERLSPRMVRIRFGGPDLQGMEWRGPAGHLKLIVPAAGMTEAELPGPDAPRSPRMRTYTPRRIDGQAGEIDIDFVLLGDGPASRWAERAQPGDKLVMMGPAPGYAVDPVAAWFLLMGDESALPALETLIEALPRGARALVRIEVEDEAEIRALPEQAQSMDVQWLPRHGAAAGAMLEEAAQQLGVLPEGAGRTYVGCEAGAVRRIRETLKSLPGSERARITGRGYWQHGKADHPDRDFVEDPA